MYCLWYNNSKISLKTSVKFYSTPKPHTENAGILFFLFVFCTNSIIFWHIHQAYFIAKLYISQHTKCKRLNFDSLSSLPPFPQKLNFIWQGQITISQSQPGPHPTDPNNQMNGPENILWNTTGSQLLTLAQKCMFNFKHEHNF